MKEGAILSSLFLFNTFCYIIPVYAL